MVKRRAYTVFVLGSAIAIAACASILGIDPPTDRPIAEDATTATDAGDASTGLDVDAGRDACPSACGASTCGQVSTACGTESCGPPCDPSTACQIDDAGVYSCRPGTCEPPDPSKLCAAACVEAKNPCGGELVKCSTECDGSVCFDKTCGCRDRDRTIKKFYNSATNAYCYQVPGLGGTECQGYAEIGTVGTIHSIYGELALYRCELSLRGYALGTNCAANYPGSVTGPRIGQCMRGPSCGAVPLHVFKTSGNTYNFTTEDGTPSGQTQQDDLCWIWTP